jgi:hypothetical protein
VFALVELFCPNGSHIRSNRSSGYLITKNHHKIRNGKKYEKEGSELVLKEIMACKSNTT